MTKFNNINNAVPRDKAAQVIPYLNHIDKLRGQLFTYKEIAELFGMASSTFRYALKRARRIVENNPSITTDEIISFKGNDKGFISDQRSSHEPIEEPNNMEDPKRIESNDLEVQCDTDNHSGHGAHESAGDTHTSEINQDQVDEEEDWAAKVMRTATPSKYAHRFNLKLKHQ